MKMIQTIQSASPPPDDRGHERPTQADRLLQVIEAKISPFQSKRGEQFVRFVVGNHLENYRVDSAEFSKWLTLEYYRAVGAPPNEAAVKQLVSVIEARAQFDGDE